MGLVEYSESSGSESESEQRHHPAPAPAPVAKPSALPPALPPALPSANTRRQDKKTIAKLVDGSGKIVVNLPATAGDATSDVGPEEPPAKRARTGGGGGLFGGFNALLPAPKNRNATAAKSFGLGKAPPPGVHLKTSAEPGFSRRAEGEDGSDGNGNGDHTGDGGRWRGGIGMQGGGVSGMALPPPKHTEHAGTWVKTKSEGEAKPAIKPLAFKPLSASAKPKKKAARARAGAGNHPSPGAAVGSALAGSAPQSKSKPAADPPISLFSFSKPSDPEEAEPPPDDDGAIGGDYRPLFAPADPDPNAPFAPPSLIDRQTGNATASSGSSPTTAPSSLAALASALNLSAAERRELLGRPRDGRVYRATAAAEVRVIDMAAEYDHNEALRASGNAVQAHVPVRAIQPGKHNARQLVNMVANQREALEESFARGRANKHEAAGRYGW